MSKETFYFSHDYNARNDIKIQALLAEHGAVGYGVYWIIVEILYEESARKLMLGNLTYVAIARQASTSVEQVKSIIECCLEYGLFAEDDGYFFSERILRNINKRMDISEKRAKAGRISAEKRRKATSVEQNSTKSNKEKERKEKESKVNSIVDTKVSMSDVAHPTQEKINYKRLIQFFNDETEGAFGKVRYPISNKRMNSIRARVKDFGEEGFAEMIRKAYQSDFLKGDSKNGFVATFDWMIRPSNFQKILEGNYDNKNDKRHGSGGKASDEELMLHIRQGIARGIQENSI